MSALLLFSVRFCFQREQHISCTLELIRFGLVFTAAFFLHFFFFYQCLSISVIDLNKNCLHIVDSSMWYVQLSHSLLFRSVELISFSLIFRYDNTFHQNEYKLNHTKMVDLSISHTYMPDTTIRIVLQSGERTIKILI